MPWCTKGVKWNIGEKPIMESQPPKCFIITQMSKANCLTHGTEDHTEEFHTDSKDLKRRRMINAGNFQEYDYEQEHLECDWKIIYKINHLVTSFDYDKEKKND